MDLYSKSPLNFITYFLFQNSTILSNWVAKIVRAHLMSDIPSKLSKFFTQKTSNVPPEQLKLNIYNPRYSANDFNDASNIKEKQLGIISSLKFKILQQDCLLTNSKILHLITLLCAGLFFVSNIKSNLKLVFPQIYSGTSGSETERSICCLPFVKNFYHYFECLDKIISHCL